ncbi:alpha-N-arabinofuranosidase [Microterricola gilva]|uniref:Alpha-N-arabinofuranosidase n=1 Tax=Microterricola gilva TaxID=393267 RepID=A0A4Q8AQG5_9MICO|nr:glycoside hydrolase family 43 protein [Microterricola gilva]RZU66363.1 alpha-N-arabinofuranosidase [Microterricola gilva]
MGRYRNPVLPGCHPDPSVCRVGDEYFIVTSTFEYFPGLPIHRSSNLVDWELIGHAVHRDDQVDLSGVPASGGLFAPTIRYNNGRFHVVCTLVHGTGRQGHFLVTARDAAGPWSQPLWLDDIGGIDPSLTFDGDRVWLCGTRLAEQGEWAEQTEVWLSERDPVSFEAIGPTHVLWRGALTGARWAEGPHLFRHGGRWLLLAAEGGTERDHAVIVAFADEITGPYTGDPGNPRLTHRDLGARAPIINVGHADLVDAVDGASGAAADSGWATLLATHTLDGVASLLGRQTHLVPVGWEADRVLFAPGFARVLESVDAAGVPDQAERPTHFVDHFDAPTLELGWNTLRSAGAERMSLSARPGHLRLVAGPGSPAETGPLAFLGRRLPSMRVTVATRLELSAPASARAEAGLLLRLSERDHLTLVVRADAAGGSTAEARLTVAGAEIALGAASVPAGAAELVLELDGFDAVLSVRGDGTSTPIAEAELTRLSPDVTGGFVGAWIGMFAVGDGTGHADVDSFELSVRD